MKRVFSILIVPFLLYAESGWYFGDNCESIKNYSLTTPLELISEYGCKPNMTEHTQSAAEMGLLAFDCSETDLQGYVNLIFGKERCLMVLKATKK
jgi:hypothetical protein